MNKAARWGAATVAALATLAAGTTQASAGTAIRHHDPAAMRPGPMVAPRDPAGVAARLAAGLSYRYRAPVGPPKRPGRHGILLVRPGSPTARARSFRIGRAELRAARAGRPDLSQVPRHKARRLAARLGGMAPQAVNGSTLAPGEALGPGQFLISPSGEYKLIMQGDGNLVEYIQGRPLWGSGTQGNPGAWVIMQGDGNLVIYSSSGQPLWSSATYGHPGASLALQDDANTCVYGGPALWCNGAYNDKLTPGQTLAPGQSVQSADRHYLLIMQGDGNLVEYVSGGRALWGSGTQNHPGAWAAMQTDGNLVVYDSAGQPLWASGTYGHDGAQVVLQNDANQCVYGGSTALWCNWADNDHMTAGDKLTANQYLESSDRRFILVMQGDGNLVEYVNGGPALWGSGTQGNPGAWAVMQGDGNLVVYTGGGQPIWGSSTQGHPGAAVFIQNDANTCVYNGGPALWCNGAHTGGGGGNLVFGTWPGTSGPGAAAQDYGYPYPNAPQCTNGGACIPDAWNFFQGQCTSWVAYRVNQLSGIGFTNQYGGNGTWGNASNWGPHAQSLGIAVNGTPAVGSVAWYSFGHVAYVEQVNSPTSIVISEMNIDLKNGFRVWTITPSSGYWPSGFIHIADR